MTKKRDFKKAKNDLRKRCGALITECNSASKTLTMGAVTDALSNSSQDVEQLVNSDPDDRSVISNLEVQSHSLGLQMFRSQTHGCLISEWHNFLTRVFKELADYCLRKKKAEIVTGGIDICLKDADFSTVATLRNSISATLTEKFSLIGYADRIKRLRKMLEINSDSLKAEEAEKMEKLVTILKKHVAVRNCLEHADGKIRKRDLNAAGQSEAISMIGSDGTERKFAENAVISVSKNDIVQLKDTMLKCREYFEVKL